MTEIRRKHDSKFREGAVRIVREIYKSIAQVARDLGINDGTLGNWVKKDRIERGDQEGLSVDERARLWFLEKENAGPRNERDVLKRSVVLWVKEAMRSCQGAKRCENEPINQQPPRAHRTSVDSVGIRSVAEGPSRLQDWAGRSFKIGE